MYSCMSQQAYACISVWRNANNCHVFAERVSVWVSVWVSVLITFDADDVACVRVVFDAFELAT